MSCTSAKPVPLPPDELSADNVLPLAVSQALGRSLYHYLATTGSTNADARQLGEHGAPHGSLVVAEAQTQGKGRHDRDWVSPPFRGIYATLLIRPDVFFREHTPLITLLAAVATVEAIRQSVPDLKPSIKWPNDVLVNGRKIAGILAEASYSAGGADFILVGIGINVNTAAAELPSRSLFPASSLAIEAGRTVSRPILLAAWLDRFAEWLDRAHEGEQTRLLAQWTEYAEMINRQVTINEIHRCIHGTVTGIDAEGALLVRTDDGETIPILSGDVCFDTMELNRLKKRSDGISRRRLARQ